ncbi:hypothetical protein RUND412_011456 [Rhizina undulata]
MKAPYSIIILGVDIESDVDGEASVPASSVGVIKDGGDGLLKKLHVSLLREDSKQLLNTWWNKLTGKSHLCVHAEVKLATFYLAHPNRRFRMCAMIQLSQANQWSSSIPARINVRIINTWKLPTFPSNTTTSPEEKTLLEQRMQLVAQDVTRELGEKVRELVEQYFGHRDTGSESSGHFEDKVDASDTAKFAAAGDRFLLLAAGK